MSGEHQSLINWIIIQVLGEMDRDQPQVKEEMVSTKQVLQVPLGGKQVMKGVHAYMEHTDLPYCVFQLFKSSYGR